MAKGNKFLKNIWGQAWWRWSFIWSSLKKHFFTTKKKKIASSFLYAVGRILWSIFVQFRCPGARTNLKLHKSIVFYLLNTNLLVVISKHLQFFHKSLRKFDIIVKKFSPSAILFLCMTADLICSHLENLRLNWALKGGVAYKSICF